MAKTRMMTQKGECYLCGKIGQTEEHHCFGGPNRKFSEKYGLKYISASPATEKGHRLSTAARTEAKTERSCTKTLRELLKLTGEREITSDRSSAAITWTRRKHDTGADQHQAGGKGLYGHPPLRA